MSSEKSRVGLIEEADPANSVAEGEAILREKREFSSRPDWIAPVILLFLDILSWAAIYGLTGWARGDEFYSTPAQLFMVEGLQLIVIIQVLFIIGGYDRQTEKRALTYTAEHILALIGAALLSSLL